MNEAKFEFNMNQVNPWGSLSTGAKVATMLAGLAVAGASIAASIFLAGAALFAGVVFVTYQWIKGNTDWMESESSIVEAEYAEVDKETPKY